MDLERSVDTVVELLKEARKTHGDVFVGVLQLFLAANDAVDDCLAAGNRNGLSYIELISLALHTIFRSTNIDPDVFIDLAQRVIDVRRNLKAPEETSRKVVH